MAASAASRSSRDKSMSEAGGRSGRASTRQNGKNTFQISSGIATMSVGTMYAGRLRKSAKAAATVIATNPRNS